MCTRARHPLVLAGLVRGRRHTVGIRRRPTHRPAEPASTPTASWNRCRSTTHHREPPHPFTFFPAAAGQSVATGTPECSGRERSARAGGAAPQPTRSAPSILSSLEPLAHPSAGRPVGWSGHHLRWPCHPALQVEANPLLNGRSRNRVAPSVPVEKEIDRFRSGCRHRHAGPRHPNARQSKGGQQRHNDQRQRACSLWPTPARRRGGGHLVQEHQWIGARTTVRNDRGALLPSSRTW